MFLQVQKHVTKKLAIQPVERVNRSRNTNNVDISDREHHLELDIIQGRGSVGISLLGTLLMPVISSAMGRYEKKERERKKRKDSNILKS